MRIKVYILMVLLFIGPPTFGHEAVERIVHQPDSLFETSSYTIYKTDTFNVRDNNGLIQGKGIFVVKDSIVQAGITVHIDCFGKDNKNTDCGTRQYPTNVYYDIDEVFYGQFKDDLKTGVWTCFWKNGNKRVELIYNQSVVQGLINIYYDTGELMYSGMAVTGQDKIELKKFTKRGLQPETIYWWLSDISKLYN